MTKSVSFLIQFVIRPRNVLMTNSSMKNMKKNTPFGSQSLRTILLIFILVFDNASKIENVSIILPSTFILRLEMAFLCMYLSISLFFISFIPFYFFFTFFYINRRKYWFCANFWFPVFDGFACFVISWTRFDYFWKNVSVSVCIWQKIVASVAQELMNRISLQLFI